MKNAIRFLAVFSFGFVSYLANAEIVKVPVDPSISTTSGAAPSYDPTVMQSTPSGPVFYVQSSDAAASSSSSETFQGEVGTLSTSIGQLLRWPALPKYTYFQTMSNNRAYYRDAFTAITYTATASQDRQTWDVKGTIVPTSGATTEFDWPTMTFYEQVAGYPYCFYTPGWAYYICGSRSIFITAYTNSQCQPYGNWTFSLYENGLYVGQRPFDMFGEVPPEDLTIQSQNSQHTYDTICYVTGSSPRKDAECGTANTTRYNIHQKGCAITSAAMVLNYHGVGATPDALDDHLVSLGAAGYTKTGKVMWSGPADYSDGVVRSFWLGPKPADTQDDVVKDRICRYGPQPMAVTNPITKTEHFVMVTGRTEDDSTWRIYDPAGGVITTLAEKYKTYHGTRLYAGQKVTYVDPLNRLIFRMYSPAEIVVTAPDGEKTGFDPIKNLRYGDIPNSAYEIEALGDNEIGQPDNHPEKVLDIGGGADGEYVVQVIGTGTGTYDLEVTRINANGDFQDQTEITGIPIEPGVTHQYSVYYSTGSSTPPTFIGGYDGGGQRPADVNRFLRYSSPSEARTSLPAGTTSARVAITYGATIDPATFTATLNGTNVGHLFSPQVGGSQTIDVPLAAGSNTLLLSVQGSTDSGRVATETDRLVFLVQ